jgi:Cu-processing system permease protein
MTRVLRDIAHLEFVTVVRRRWVQLFAAAFGSVVLAVAYSSGSIHELGGADTMGRTTVALVPLVVTLVPMVALLLGISGHASEPGSEAFLFAQPVSRGQVLVGKWLGGLGALGLAIVMGFGVGGMLLISEVGVADVAKFAFLVAATLLLAASFLSLGALVAAAVPGRVTALGTGVFVWFCAVLLYDGLLLAAAQWLTGRLGARLLFVSIFGNPTDLVRVLSLSVSGTPYVLGAAAESWHRFLGGPERAMLLSGLVLLLWVAVPLAAARRCLSRRDL